MNRQPQNGPQRPQKAAQGPENRNPGPASAGQYKAIYRAVYDYHERHRPYPASPEAWKAAAEDMARTAAAGGGDPFLNSLLLAVFDELERQQKKAEAGAKNQTKLE